MTLDHAIKVAKQMAAQSGRGTYVVHEPSEHETEETGFHCGDALAISALFPDARRIASVFPDSRTELIPTAAAA